MAHAVSLATGRRDTDEIEVTEAMIAAGMKEYLGCWVGLRDAEADAAEAMLARAFRATAVRQ